MIICLPCASGYHHECKTPDPEGYCHCYADAEPVVIEATDKKLRGGQYKDREDVTDIESTGRKRTAILYPLDREADCEWKELKSCGGAVVPVMGCIAGKQQAAHHGPDKNTLTITVNNVHRICHTCLTSEMRILTRDLRWVKVSNVAEGDWLVGFNEDIENKMHYEPSRVESVEVIQKPCWRFTMADGSVLESSNDHQWVASPPVRPTMAWRRSDSLKNGYNLRKVFSPWTVDKSWDAGWFAGFLDGEGSLSGYHLSYGQTEGKNGSVVDIMYEMANKYADNKIHETHRPATAKTQEAWVVRHTNLPDITKIIGTVRPVKMLEQFDDFIFAGGRNKTGRQAKGKLTAIVKKEYIGIQTVYSIQTTSRTYIAEGFLSHNCHNRFHTENDRYYSGERPQGDTPYLPLPEYDLVPHDPRTRFTPEEFAQNEIMWMSRKNKKKTS